MKKNYHAVIMAGGIGSRFWPLSRNKKPKQFIDILGVGKSFIQLTFDRLCKVVPSENIWVVTHKDYEHLVKEHLPIIKDKQILIEPERKNTAPCVAYAASEIKLIGEDNLMLVAPADHFILNEKQFIDDCEVCFKFLEKNDGLLTIGIQPSRPDTAYGYIKYNMENPIEDDIHEVMHFVEKPNHNKALSYLNEGGYLWNSGMFMWKATEILNEFAIHMPDIYSLFENYQPDGIESIYAKVRSESIDYGIMEKAAKVFVKTADFGWSDIGSWSSFYELSEQDENQNAITANVVCYDTQECVIHNKESKLIAVQGLQNYVIINTEDILMICNKTEEQKIKQIVADVSEKFGSKWV